MHLAHAARPDARPAASTKRLLYSVRAWIAVSVVLRLGVRIDGSAQSRLSMNGSGNAAHDEAIDAAAEILRIFDVEPGVVVDRRMVVLEKELLHRRAAHRQIELAGRPPASRRGPIRHRAASRFIRHSSRLPPSILAAAGSLGRHLPIDGAGDDQPVQAL